MSSFSFSSGAVGALMLLGTLAGAARPWHTADPTHRSGWDPPGVQPAQQLRLGPADGRDLPATELDRVSVGTEAPDFTLMSLAGVPWTLSEFRGQQDVILVFYRGYW